MIKDPKTLIDMGLNAAICGSFAVPAVGPMIAGGLAGGRFLFDAFFPFPNRMDPMSLTPNKADLKNAMDYLAGQIDEEFFTTEEDDKSTTLLDENDRFRARFEDVSNNKLPVYLGSSAAKVQSAQWQKDFEGYFDTGSSGNTIDVLNDVANWVQFHLSHQNQTLPLYTYAVGLFVSYCKLGMTYEVNSIKNQYQKDLADYEADPAVKAWKTAALQWKHADAQTRGPQPLSPKVKPEAPYAVDQKGMTAQEIKDAEDAQTKLFKANSVFAEKLRLYLPGYIQYAKALHATLESDLTQREKALAPYAPKKPTGRETLAEQQQEVANGVKYAAIWKQLTAKYKLDGIDQKTVDTLGESVKQWEDTLAQYQGT